MGQRLVLTVKNNKKDLMKIYYHWSGYTASAQETLCDLATVVKDAKADGLDEHGVLLKIIEKVEQVDDEEKDLFGQFGHTCCGGIDGGEYIYEYNPETKKNEKQGKNPEWDYITKLFPEHEFNKNPDRNDGLIAMTETGMEDIQQWSEGDASINIDTGDCHNEVLWDYCKEHWFEYRDDCGETKEEAEKLYKKLPLCDDDYFNFNLFEDGEIKRCYNGGMDLCQSSYLAYKTSDGDVHELMG